MTLENYLADEYNRDLQDINAIEQVLIRVADMFVAAFDNSSRCWPYELIADAKIIAGKQSHGTSAMILAAIGKMLCRCTLRDGSTF